MHVFLAGLGLVNIALLAHATTVIQDPRNQYLSARQRTFGTYQFHAMSAAMAIVVGSLFC